MSSLGVKSYLFFVKMTHLHEFSLYLKKSRENRRRESLAAAFEKIDLNKDGYITSDEYCQYLEKHGFSHSRRASLQVMHIADKDCDGKISKEELVHEKSCTPPKRDKAELVFDFMDTDRDGYVTKKQLMRLCRNLTKEQVNVIFQKNDGDHDGRLSREEFKIIMDRHKVKQKGNV